MSDNRYSIQITLLSFFQPFLSVLGPVLFFQNYYRDQFLFRGIYLLLLIILIGGGILLFRPFCRKNLYVFEDLGSAMTERINLAVWLVCLAAAIASVRFAPQLFFLSIPLGVALLFSYTINLFHFLQTSAIGGIVSLAYRHIKMLKSFVFAIMAAKVLFTVIVHFLDFPSIPSYSMAFGFAADTLLILFLRAHGNRLEIQKEGFDQINEKSLRSGFPLLLFLSAILVAAFLSGQRSLLNPQLLKRFYLWLISLSKEMPLRSGEIELEASSGPTAEEMESMHTYWESRKADFAFLRKIFDILEYAMIIVIALLIIYFVFYPIIAPFLFRNRKKISFREYYSSIYEWIKNLFASLAGLFKSFFPKQGMIRENVEEAKGFNSSVGYKASPSGAAKRAELRALYRLYGKLKSKGSSHLNMYAIQSCSVGEFFAGLSESDIRWEYYCSPLTILFNKSFFSPERLNSDEMRRLKRLSADLLKEL